jgi:hypothetical protein
MRVFKVQPKLKSAPPKNSKAESWYKDVYLNSDHWKDVRNRYIQKHGNYCQTCGSRRSLQLHHKTYERLWAERLNDLVMLCDIHHAEQHDISKEQVKHRRKMRLWYNRAVRNATYTYRQRLPRGKW